jgi:hypothetical protein
VVLLGHLLWNRTACRVRIFRSKRVFLIRLALSHGEIAGSNTAYAAGHIGERLTQVPEDGPHYSRNRAVEQVVKSALSSNKAFSTLGAHHRADDVVDGSTLFCCSRF